MDKFNSCDNNFAYLVLTIQTKFFLQEGQGVKLELGLACYCLGKWDLGHLSLNVKYGKEITIT